MPEVFFGSARQSALQLALTAATEAKGLGISLLIVG
jgi:hypothetical protein